MIGSRIFQFIPLAFGLSSPAANGLIPPRAYRLEHPPPPHPKPFAHGLNGDQEAHAIALRAANYSRMKKPLCPVIAANPAESARILL